MTTRMKERGVQKDEKIRYIRDAKKFFPKKGGIFCSSPQRAHDGKSSEIPFDDN